MIILNRYVMSTLIKATLLILLVFVGFEVFILMATQLNSLGKGSYTIWQAFLYILLTLPQETYLLFPVAGLLGMLAGFSWLANHSELIVMRTAGVSPLQILKYALQAGILMIILMMLIGEGIAPKAKLFAEKRKLIEMSAGQVLKTSSGLWLRQGQDFYYIKTIYSAHYIAEVSRYTFEHQQLIRTDSAKEGYYQGGAWQMRHVKESYINDQKITAAVLPHAVWNLDINPHLLSISQRSPEEMSLFQLSDLINYQNRSHLISHTEQIAFWQRICQPFSILVMMFLAIPFVFGPLRSVTTSLRLVLGVIVGFAFYLSNELFPPLSQVLDFPPVIAAILPPLVFGVLGIILFRRI
jgi:lipopolysaccharide export system permease protein